MTKVLAKISESLFFLSILIFFILIKPINLFAADPTSAWAPTTSLPYLLASHVSFSSGDKVFVIAGSAVTGQSKYDVLSSTIGLNGNLSNWDSTSEPLPTAPIWHALVKKDNHVYVLGGKEENPGTPNASVDKVFLGSINNSGVVTSWVAVNDLPTPSALGAAAVVGNRIYFAGGFNEGNGPTVVNQNVYFAPINADGTIGS